MCIVIAQTVTKPQRCFFDCESFDVQPSEVRYFEHAFPATHLFQRSNDDVWDSYITNGPPHVFVGMEPLDKSMREHRYRSFTCNTRVRYALMLDSGAPRSASGMQWATRFISEFGLESLCTWETFKAKLSGIGEGSASVN